MGPFRLLGFGLYALGVLFLLAILVGNANATPLFVAEHEGVVVTLTDERCAVKEISNLELRATWVEKGKTFEGCWGTSNGFVVSYWREDRTVAMFSAGVFKRLKSI